MVGGDEEKLDILEKGGIHTARQRAVFWAGQSIKKDHPMERQGLGKVSELALVMAAVSVRTGTCKKDIKVDLHPVYDLLWNATTGSGKKSWPKSVHPVYRASGKAEDPDPLDRESGYVADIIKQRWRVKTGVSSNFGMIWREPRFRPF